ncbi:MAG: Aspartokinase [Claussenomyces sp. TS43310]|nr:MAG: Aspartokinase [Claussenomyces sp. TS43310]
MSANGLTNGHKCAVYKNNSSSSNGWVVQKFGGTSVGKFPVNIAEDIVRASLTDNKVAVVCSARSTGKKIEGSTSRLLEIYSVLEQVNSVKETEVVHRETLVQEYERLVQIICQDHINAARLNIQDAGLQVSLIEEIKAECKEITDYRQAAERWHLEIDSRSKDRIISYGEKLSCRFMTAVLLDRGVDAEFVDLADVVHLKPTDSLDRDFYAGMADALKKKIGACENRIPVITGFFGVVPGGLIDGEIGRGYTDLCAALVAVGVGADELQVWKEVDGIFTADPSKVPTARLLSTITPAEAAELTFYGSEVIHHLTMDQVIHASPPIRIRIKNVKNPRGNGTIIVPDPVLAPGQSMLNAQVRNSMLSSSKMMPKRPTAVTIKDKITVINVHSNKRSISHGFFAKVFSILDKRQVSVDLISTSEVHVSMAIHAANISEEELKRAREDLEECGEVCIVPKMAIVSLVGAQMKNMVGIAGRMFSTLGEHNINLEMISQGTPTVIFFPERLLEF